MAIGYSLGKSNLTGGKNSYTATIRAAGTVGIDQIAARIAGQSLNINRSHIKAILEAAGQAACFYLLEGFRVMLCGICELSPTIKGRFDNPSDIFDPARHKADITAVPAAGIRRCFRAKARFKKQQSIKPVPQPLQLFDLASSSANRIVTGNSIGTLKGRRLKFNPEKSDEGIFLVPTNKSLPVIKAPIIVKNRPSELLFQIPAICKGNHYRLEVRKRFSAKGELRCGKLTADLTAAAGSKTRLSGRTAKSNTSKPSFITSKQTASLTAGR
jgi:hypothetical protein